MERCLNAREYCGFQDADDTGTETVEREVKMYTASQGN